MMAFCKIFGKNRLNRLFRILIIVAVSAYLLIFWARNHGEQDDDAKEKNKIYSPKNAMCIVLTTEISILTRGVAVWKTWGPECQKLVFMCSCKNINKYVELKKSLMTIPEELKKFEPVADYPIMFLDIEENYERMGEKVVHVLKQTYRKYKQDFLWYYLVDDDTYVFVNNLNKFTNARNASAPEYYGFKFNVMVPNGYIGGGAGILFTNESMRRIVTNMENKECDKFIDMYGDITIGNCANSVSVVIGNSTDDQKKPRFHPHDPKTHFFGPVPQPLYTAGSHNGKIGKDCCSIETISFHYVTIEDMYAMYANKTFLHDLLL